MAGWGSADVAAWGVGGEIANTLWLYINRDVPNIGALGDIIDLRTDAHTAVLQALDAAFDLASAVGDQLDILGALLGFPRVGLTDDRYRRALKVQRSSILSSAGTRPTMIQVFTDWTTNVPESYRDIPPNEFEITGKVAVADEALLLEFITKAAPAGRIISVYQVPNDHLANAYAGDTVAEGVVFNPAMETLVDPVSGLVGVATGTTYIAANDSRDFEADDSDRVVYQTPNPIDLSGSPLSISMRINRESSGASGYLLEVRGTGGGARSLTFRVDALDRLQFLHEFSGTDVERVSDPLIGSVGTDLHVMVTYDAVGTFAGIRLYVDGVEQTYAVETNSTGTPELLDLAWTLGGRLSAVESFDGEISDVRVWDRVLSAEEAARVFNGRDGDPAFADIDAGFESLRTDIEFEPNMVTLVDPISGLTGVVTGATVINGRNARNFDGTDDRIEYASVQDLTAAPFTLSAFLTPTAIGGNDRFMDWRTAGNIDSIRLQIISAGPGRVSLRHEQVSGGALRRVTSTVLAVDVETHVAITYDGLNLAAGVRIFFDGVEQAYSVTTDGGGAARDVAGVWTLGASAAGGEAWPGIIRDPKVYSRVLADFEVLALAQGRDGVISSGLDSSFTDYAQNPIAGAAPTAGRIT